MELAGGLVPQGGLVKGARAGWKFVWLQMMRELAPQSPDGAYVRYFPAPSVAGNTVSGLCLSAIGLEAIRATLPPPVLWRSRPHRLSLCRLLPSRIILLVNYRLNVYMGCLSIEIWVVVSIASVNGFDVCGIGREDENPKL